MKIDSVAQLNLSARAQNVLKRMGIEGIEELISTPEEEILEQRGVGIKTLGEILRAVTKICENPEAMMQDLREKTMMTSVRLSEDMLREMAQHSLKELSMTARLYEVLQEAGCDTIDKVATMTVNDFMQRKGVGRKTVNTLKMEVDRWIHKNLLMDDIVSISEEDVDPEVKAKLKYVSNLLESIVHVHWRQIYAYAYQDGKLQNIPSISNREMLRMVQGLKGLRPQFFAFWESIAQNDVIQREILEDYLKKLSLPFDYQEFVRIAIEERFLIPFSDTYLLYRQTFREAFDAMPISNARTREFLTLRMEGKALQEIKDMYGLSRENIRQITRRQIARFPKIVEEYFKEPYVYFQMRKRQFLEVFPLISPEGYEYLGMRYRKGKHPLTSESLEDYTGMWKTYLMRFLESKTEKRQKETTKIGAVKRVLIENAGRSLSLSELEKAYYEYIERKELARENFQVNFDIIRNYLSVEKNIVYNQNDEVRYCPVDAQRIWDTVDFTRYQNKVISAWLIYQDYHDLMEELDIRDGHELFYAMKTSASLWEKRALYPIRFRRVPTMEMGEGSEEAQTVDLLRELSPIPANDYFAAYEKR